MVAGEASGDLLAGLLLQALRARWPALVAAGIGGPRMAAQGFQAWWPHHKLSVHGFGWDVLLRYREIVGIRKQLLHRLTKDKPKKTCAAKASRRCILCAPRSGRGAQSGSKSFAAAWTTCCVFFRLSLRC